MNKFIQLYVGIFYLTALVSKIQTGEVSSKLFFTSLLGAVVIEGFDYFKKKLDGNEKRRIH